MNFKKTTLANGLRIITVPMKDNPAVTVLVMAEVGSEYENKTTSGLSHYLEHMVFKGTNRRPRAIDISLELDAIGAQYNAFTGQEYTGYYAKADSKHIRTCIDVVSDMYIDALFDPKEMEKEKGVIIEELKMYKDIPQHQVQELFSTTVYGDQPAGWSIGGTEATVSSFTREGLLKYRNEHYVPESTIVAVAGSFGDSFTEESLIAHIEKVFSVLPSNPKVPKSVVVEEQKIPNVAIEYKETDQTHMIMGVRSFATTDSRVPALRVLATILGKGMSSRLFQKLRDEMGVGYYVHVDNDVSHDHGVFSISTGVDTSRVEEVVGVLVAECKKFLIGAPDVAIPAAELRKAKDYIIGGMMLSLETSDSRAEFAVFQEIFKKTLRTPEAIAADVEAVTAAQIQDVARDIFRDERLNFALIGRFKDTVPFKKLLTFR